MSTRISIELLALFIPIITIVIGGAIAIVIIIASYRRKAQRDDMRHKERMAALEKGLEVPPDPVESDTGTKANGLRSGLSGILIGVVLYFALRGIADEDFALFGLIPAAIGIANLASFFVESKRISRR